MRACANGLISGKMSGICVPWAIDEEPNKVCLRCWAGFCGSSATSSKVFHAPQSGHLPTHLLCSPPHCWQIYFVRSFAIHSVLEHVRGDNARSRIVSPHMFYPLTRFTKFRCLHHFHHYQRRALLRV